MKKMGGISVETTIDRLSHKTKKALCGSLKKDRSAQAFKHPAFGMWKDCIDDADVPGIVRNMRKKRIHVV
jgi:hypothetical protein